MSDYNSCIEFLYSCVKTGKIPMSYVRSPEFAKLLEEFDISKEPAYEELFYSRDQYLNITNTRDEAKYYHEHKDVFSVDENNKITTKVDIDLGKGYQGYTFYSRGSVAHENVKGTKFVALKNYECATKSKIKVDIITSRHTLLDLLLIPFQKFHFNHCVVYFDSQIFLESKRTAKFKIDKPNMSGYNFEEVVTFNGQEDMVQPFNFEPPVSNATKYNSMVIHKFPELNTKVLVSCEIDAIKEDPEIIRQRFNNYTFKRKILENNIELKASTQAISKNTQRAVAQCYAAGTNDLIVGLKDKKLMLKGLIKYNVNDILSSESTLFNKKFLDKWFGFISQFIKLSIEKYPRKYKKGYFRIIYIPQEDIVKLYPIKLTQDEIDLTVIPSFINWRCLLRNIRRNKKDNIEEVTELFESANIDNKVTRIKEEESQIQISGYHGTCISDCSLGEQEKIKMKK